MAQPTLTVTPDSVVVKVNADQEVLTETNGTLTVTKDNDNVSISNGDSEGSKKITGVTAGSSVVTFTATETDGTETNVKTVPVVIDKENGEALLELSKSTVSTKEGAEATSITVTTTADDFTVESDNGNVTVAKGENKTFTITPVKGGSSVVTVKVTSKSKVETSATVNVTVEAKPTLVVEPTSVDFKVNKQQILTIETNQSDFGYVIEPSDIATFDKESKTLTAVKQGTGKITIYVNKGLDNELSKEVALTIAEADVTQLDVTPTNPTVVVGGNVKLTVTTNASDYTVANTNSTAVSFDKSTSTVTANAVGSATLTFTAKYGEGDEVSKQVIITVEAAPVEPTYLEVTTSTPLSVVKGDTKVFTIDTNAEDYSVELNNNNLAEYSKETKTLTTKQPGAVTIKFSATKEGSTTVDKSFTIDIADTTLSATVSEIEVKVGGEVNFDIESNIITEVKATAEDEEKIAIAKNSNRVTVNGLEIGSTSIRLEGRDKFVVIPVSVVVDTVLEVSEQPSTIYVGKDITVQVKTNAPTYNVTSEHVGIIGVVKGDGGTFTLSSVSGGVSNITVSATANGGKEVVITWPMTSIQETNYTREEVDKILTNSKTTIEEKLNSFANDKSEFGVFVNNLIQYSKNMDPDSEETVTDEKGAARNYNLYIQMRDAIEEEDYLTFKSKFDIINMAYAVYSKGAFNEFALFRYDQAWSAKWGDLSLTTFQNLNTLICTLCDISTRASELDSLSLDKSLDLTKIELTELGANNIKKYYNV